MRGQTMTEQRYNNNKTTKNPALANVENLYKMNNFWKKYKIQKNGTTTKRNIEQTNNYLGN